MLKIDLLPRHFAIARTNKRILVAGIILLVVVGVGFWLKHGTIRAEIARTDEKIAEVKLIADNVRELEGEISEKQGWLDPIKSKIDFVENADETGDKYFDCFHSINEYIWEGAQMSSFSITSSGGGAAGPSRRMDEMMMGPGAAQPTGGTASAVQFTVEVRGTAGVGRFLLNLLRCPDLANITYSGVPGGQSITATGAGAATTAAAGPLGPEMPVPGGGPAGRPMGAGTTSQAAGVEPGSPSEPITLQISATLTEPITVPSPPDGAAAAMGGLMGPGMMGPGELPPE